MNIVLGAIAVFTVAVAIALPYLLRPREGCGGAIECSSNLRQIGLAMKLYALYHDNAYPPDFQTLLATEDIEPQAFICPSSNDDRATPSSTTGPASKPFYSLGPGHCSYIYCVPLGFTSQQENPNTILVYELPSNHENTGMNVLYADDHVEWISDTAWVVSELKAGHNPPTTQTTTKPRF